MMKQLRYILVAAFAALLALSCAPDVPVEQYRRYVSLRAPLSSSGVCNVYVPFSRKDAEGFYSNGISSYDLTVELSGTAPNDRNYTVYLTGDADTLAQLNQERFQGREDLFFKEMSFYAWYPETVTIPKGERMALLHIEFDFKGIDMSEKWVLPITVAESPDGSYTPHPRRHFNNALLRFFPFNDYSGPYSGTALNIFLSGQESEGGLVKNNVELYAVDENTAFFYAGIVDESRTDRKNYKVFIRFDDDGTCDLYSDNPEMDFSSTVHPTYRISKRADDVQPYLVHRFLIINNIDFEFSDYTAIPGTPIRYHVQGALSSERKINTQIPDEDQAVDW